MLEVAQEAIFIRISGFQQHKRTRWGNPHILKHNENFISSSAEAKVGEMFHNTKEGEPIRSTLE